MKKGVCGVREGWVWPEEMGGWYEKRVGGMRKKVGGVRKWVGGVKKGWWSGGGGVGVVW